MTSRMRVAVSIVLTLAICGGALSSCKKTGKGTAYSNEVVGFQLGSPKKGEDIAVVHTSMGDIYVRLFPEAAPKAVSNFITHAQNGYYNGLTFHYVMSGFMIQTGDPKGDGTGGESIWGEDFEDEFNSKLFNLRGSLAMANAGEATNGSQFLINQVKADAFLGKEKYLAETKEYKIKTKEYYESNIQTLKDNYKSWEDLIGAMSPALTPDADLVPQDVWDMYEKNGGNIYLDGMWRHDKGGHTVFAQVYDGMDVVDAIAAVGVDPKTSKPLKDVTIKNIEILRYA